MIQQFNYSYNIDYKNVNHFQWTQRNDIVGYESYKDRIMPRLKLLVDYLNNDMNTRHGIIVINENDDHMSCLISIQFQVCKKFLYVSANFRSQHIKLGRPHDEELINYLTTWLKNKLKYIISNVSIKVNVANYHK